MGIYRNVDNEDSSRITIQRDNVHFPRLYRQSDIVQHLNSQFVRYFRTKSVYFGPKIDLVDICLFQMENLATTGRGDLLEGFISGMAPVSAVTGHNEYYLKFSPFHVEYNKSGRVNGKGPPVNTPALAFIHV